MSKMYLPQSSAREYIPSVSPLQRSLSPMYWTNSNNRIQRVASTATSTVDGIPRFPVGYAQSPQFNGQRVVYSASTPSSRMVQLTPGLHSQSYTQQQEYEDFPAQPEPTISGTTSVHNLRGSMKLLRTNESQGQPASVELHFHMDVAPSEPTSGIKGIEGMVRLKQQGKENDVAPDPHHTYSTAQKHWQPTPHLSRSAVSEQVHQLPASQKTEAYHYPVSYDACTNSTGQRPVASVLPNTPWYAPRSCSPEHLGYHQSESGIPIQSRSMGVADIARDPNERMFQSGARISNNYEEYRSYQRRGITGDTVITMPPIRPQSFTSRNIPVAMRYMDPIVPSSIECFGHSRSPLGNIYFDQSMATTLRRSNGSLCRSSLEPLSPLMTGARSVPRSGIEPFGEPGYMSRSTSGPTRGTQSCFAYSKEDRPPLLDKQHSGMSNQMLCRETNWNNRSISGTCDDSERRSISGTCQAGLHLIGTPTARGVSFERPEFFDSTGMMDGPSVHCTFSPAEMPSSPVATISLLSDYSRDNHEVSGVSKDNTSVGSIGKSQPSSSVGSATASDTTRKLSSISAREICPTTQQRNISKKKNRNGSKVSSEAAPAQLPPLLVKKQTRVPSGKESSVLSDQYPVDIVEAKEPTIATNHSQPSHSVKYNAEVSSCEGSAETSLQQKRSHKLLSHSRRSNESISDKEFYFNNRTNFADHTLSTWSTSSYETSDYPVVDMEIILPPPPPPKPDMHACATSTYIPREEPKKCSSKMMNLLGRELLKLRG